MKLTRLVFVNRRLEVQFLSPAPQFTRLPSLVCYRSPTTPSNWAVQPINRCLTFHNARFTADQAKTGKQLFFALTEGHP